MSCQWNSSAECQFATLDEELVTFENKSYCHFHLPSRSDQKEPPQQFKERVDQKHAQTGSAGWTKFEGVSFPRSSDGSLQHYIFHGVVDLRRCSFAADVKLILDGDGDVDLANSLFAGSANFECKGEGKRLNCTNVRFVGDLSVEFLKCESGKGDFCHCNFESTVSVSGTKQLAGLYFNKCKFDSAPKFRVGDQLPQKTSFDEAKFEFPPQDEWAFRAIRNLFSENRAREDEGRFYAYEKRCHRRNLRPRRKIFTRFVSWIYDVTSMYGLRYERALICFLIVQVLFGLIYAWISDRLSNIGGGYDSHIVGFTLAQLVKPFELFGSKLTLQDTYSIVRPEQLGLWQCLTLLQSLLSIVLIAMLLIAIRWRFRRE